jgi:hypothetical protein
MPGKCSAHTSEHPGFYGMVSFAMSHGFFLLNCSLPVTLCPPSLQSQCHVKFFPYPSSHHLSGLPTVQSRNSALHSGASIFITVCSTPLCLNPIVSSTRVSKPLHPCSGMHHRDLLTVRVRYKDPLSLLSPQTSGHSGEDIFKKWNHRQQSFSCPHT